MKFHNLLLAATLAPAFQIAMPQDNTGADASANAAAKNASKADLEEWRRATTAAPPAKQGCYKIEYPSKTWLKVSCGPKPVHLPVTRHLQQTPATRKPPVPNVQQSSGDYIIQPQNPISSATGRIIALNNVTSFGSQKINSDGTRGPYAANQFSLQLNSNSNFPASTGSLACAGSPNTSTTNPCQGWIQFVYDNTRLSVIEYWAIHYRSLTSQKCPSSVPHDPGTPQNPSLDCYNAAAYGHVPSSFPNDFSKMQGATIQAQALSNGMVALTLTAGGVSHLIQGPDPIGLVGSAWTQAEFNVFGYDGGDTVEFNAGAQVTMGLTSDNDASGVIPDCPNASTTGENSNLLLGPCYTTSVPGIWFNESPTTPQIQSVSPSQGPAAGGTTVNLLGGPFDQQQFQITFGNPAVSPTNTLPNDVSVLSPPGKVGSSVDINAAYVFPNGGLGPFSAPVSFTYLPDPPACSFSILSCPFYQNQPPDYTIACPAPVDFYTTSDTNTPSDFNLIQQDATTNTGTTTDQQVSLAACKLGNKTQCTFDSTYVPVANWCINHNGGGGGGGGGSTTCSKCGGGQCCPNPYGGPGIVCVPKGKPCPPLQ